MNTTILSLDKSPEPRADRFLQPRTTASRRGCDRASASEHTSGSAGSSQQLRARYLAFSGKRALLLLLVLFLTSRVATAASSTAVTDEGKLVRSRLEMVAKDLRARGI